MASNSQTPEVNPPQKPWERAVPSSAGPTPFKPPSAGNTSDVVEASGTARPGEVVSTSGRSAIVNRNRFTQPVPPRPWEPQTYGSSTYGGYGSGLNYNPGFGTGIYDGLGRGSYGSALYGNNMYRGGYGGLYGGGMYGGGMYGNGYGGPMGSYGMGMGSPNDNQDPNNPFGPPSSPPGFWISLMRVLQGVVSVFGRFSMLVDQNTQALHMFMSALLQLFDRFGLLYGELARFVFRILGIRTKPKKVHPAGPRQEDFRGSQQLVEPAKAAPTGAWDSVWGGVAE